MGYYATVFGRNTLIKTTATMTESQLQQGNDLVKLKDKVFTNFQSSREIVIGQFNVIGKFEENRHTYTVDHKLEDLTDFAKTCSTLLNALFDAEEKRLTELFNKRLSNI